MKTIEEIVEMIAKRVHCELSGSCGVFATWFTRVLIKNGYHDFVIVFGFVDNMEHIWIEMNDKTIIDPTVIQFKGPKIYSKKTKRIDPIDFLNMKYFTLNQKTKNWYKAYIKSKY